MSTTTVPALSNATPVGSNLAERRRQRAKPIRAHSAIDPYKDNLSTTPVRTHSRHKSTITMLDNLKDTTPSPQHASAHLTGHQVNGCREESSPISPFEASPAAAANSSAYGLLSPPETPSKSVGGAGTSGEASVHDIMTYDFSRIDYELERAHSLGQGLWSNVWLADAKYATRIEDSIDPFTPPSTPPRRHTIAASSVFAVKTPARPDAREVFVQEAKVLTHLMRRPSASQFVVTLVGLDQRNSALIFEAVIGGSLESLTGRLRQMTEVSRHLELVSLFPGLTNDLVNGLEFLHAHGVVHADIKPANVLLDISDHPSLPKPVVRARYIDFSAAFRLDSGDSTANAGGTWDFMAPEQMRIKPEFNTPTSASDVWSLGITLLTLLVGGSPYTAACGDNVFMIREAIKSGDPLSFARMSPKVQKRMAAAQDFVDCCRLALQKDRLRRPTATSWKTWLIGRDLPE